jgi:hypothetical protein
MEMQKLMGISAGQEDIESLEQSIKLFAQRLPQTALAVSLSDHFSSFITD